MWNVPLCKIHGLSLFPGVFYACKKKLGTEMRVWINKYHPVPSVLNSGIWHKEHLHGDLSWTGPAKSFLFPCIPPQWLEGVVHVAVQQIHSQKWLRFKKKLFSCSALFPPRSLGALVLWSCHKRGIDGGWGWQCSTAASSLTNVWDMMLLEKLKGYFALPKPPRLVWRWSFSCERFWISAHWAFCYHEVQKWLLAASLHVFLWVSK